MKEKYLNLSGLEFKKAFDKNDVVCVLANVLLKESVFTVQDLSHAKEHIRQKFIEEALKLIKNLNEHNLWLVHKNE